MVNANGAKPIVKPSTTTPSGWPVYFFDVTATELGMRFADTADKDNSPLPRSVEVTVKRIIRDRGRWPTAEVQVDLPAKNGDRLRRVYRSRLSLLSSSAKRDCVRTCKDVGPELAPHWSEIVEKFTDEALSTMSERIKPVMLGNGAVNRDRPKMHVYPLLQDHAPNLLWGNSDAGKSWLALYVCALVDVGAAVNGFDAHEGRSLYIDYEENNDAMDERMRAVRSGLYPHVEDTWGLRYQNVTGPLTDWIDDVAKYIAKEEIDLVVIDSLGQALGGVVNESENVIKLFQSVRELDATTLLIDHQGKGDDAAERGAIGSSYKRHYARSVWEMRRENEDTFEVGLYHRKANNAKRSAPIGLNIDIQSDEDGRAQIATFTPTQVSDSPVLAKGLSIPQRIKPMLSDGAKTVEYIRHDLSDQSKESIDSSLSWMVRKGIIIRPERSLYALPEGQN